MADQSKFEHKPGATLLCEEWEALLVDSLDGLLPAKETAAFTAHSESCANCGDLLAHAQQGREWLGYLHAEPDVPTGLLGRILEKTAGPGAMPLPALAGAEQGSGAMVMPWRRNFHETRLLMTVAMAFFSIALTLNLLDVHLGSLRLADLKPSQIGNTISRQFYTGWGSVVRFYDNARFVYQLESRMRELRRDVQQQQQENQKKPEPSKPGASGNKDGRLNTAPERGAMLNASRDAEQNAEEQDAGYTAHVQQDRTKAIEVRVSVVNGSSISLGQSETGLQEADQTAAHDRRSLV
jgi:hypothetical protein